ncbi:MAG: dephospho-CoA kinase [Bacteroidales bacterium]
MKKIGITGNIGSGKSLVCSIFEQLKVPVFYADSEAKKLYSKADIYAQMTARFGTGIYQSDKSILPAKLGQIIFGDEEHRRFVTSILYPALHERYAEWLKENETADYILYEAAILFETGNNSLFDAMIVVDAPIAIRQQRVMLRDGSNEKEVLEKMKLQWSDERKACLADFVIRNDGKSLLIPQVMEIHRQLVCRK